MSRQVTITMDIQDGDRYAVYTNLDNEVELNFFADYMGAADYALRMVNDNRTVWAVWADIVDFERKTVKHVQGFAPSFRGAAAVKVTL